MRGQGTAGMCVSRLCVWVCRAPYWFASPEEQLVSSQGEVASFPALDELPADLLLLQLPLDQWLPLLVNNCRTNTEQNRKQEREKEDLQQISAGLSIDLKVLSFRWFHDLDLTFESHWTALCLWMIVKDYQWTEKKMVCEIIIMCILGNKQFILFSKVIYPPNLKCLQDEARSGLAHETIHPTCSEFIITSVWHILLFRFFF